jgi:hypothetical protein
VLAAPRPAAREPQPEDEGRPTFPQKRKLHEACEKLDPADASALAALVRERSAAAAEEVPTAPGIKMCRVDLDALDTEAFEAASKKLGQLQPDLMRG